MRCITTYFFIATCQPQQYSKVQDFPQELLGKNLRKHKFELSNSIKIQKFRFFDTNFLGQNLGKLTFKSCRDALQDAGIDFETSAPENTN